MILSKQYKNPLRNFLWSVIIMYTKKSVVLLLMFTFSALVACVHEFDQKKLNGTCPKIKYITNLDLSRIVGWHYRPLSNLNNPLCYKNQAQTMLAAQWDDTGIVVNMCCRSAANTSLPICGSNVGSGLATAISPGEFTYTFGNNVYPSYVLDTDYVNFMIVYGCKPGTPAYKRDEYVFVYSRSYTLSNAVQDRVRKSIEANNIQWSDVKAVDQGPALPYLPLPKQ